MVAAFSNSSGTASEQLFAEAAAFGVAQDVRPLLKARLAVVVRSLNAIGGITCSGAVAKRMPAPNYSERVSKVMESRDEGDDSYEQREQR